MNKTGESESPWGAHFVVVEETAEHAHELGPVDGVECSRQVNAEEMVYLVIALDTCSDPAVGPNGISGAATGAEAALMW
ncbi:unnamed protein product [Phytophthora fragariaefolia]|uniref:Unnamed protein product n=1 Tax=Phytophthora fragariaefolia TaxID=1490495 RepID=A0A9W6YBE4_9STRA|nr:unnamed protein product [Phytophthora fragariaefolia]